MKSDYHTDKKDLLSNFFSLSMLQGVNMLLPLITLPYLVRVLGVENYGLISLSLAIIMLFNIVVGFGFELSATKDISINKSDVDRISEIFSAVISIKIIILFVAFIVLMFLIEYVKIMHENSILFYATFGVVIGNAIFPLWLFQGMEKMKYITYINVSTMSFFTILIFIFVKDEKDLVYVPLLNSLGVIVGALYSLRLAKKVFNIKYILPEKGSALLHFKKGYTFFLSRVANNGSRYYATTIVGVYFGNLVVGYYSIAEKLFHAFISLGGIISQVVYPYMCRTKNILFLRKVLVIVGLTSIILLIPVIYYNEFILYILFDKQNKILSDIFIILFFGSFFSIVGSLIGYPLLAAFNYDKHANNSLIYGSILYITLTTISVFFLNNVYLVAASMIVFKFTVLILRIIYIQKEKIHFFRLKNE